MQKTILTIVMGILCLIFKAEAQINKAIDLTSKGIQIGQKVPDVLLNNIYNYKVATAKLSDFKYKLIILDFWATWCGACISMMPKLEKLQNQFSNQLQILPVTYQTEAVAIPFLEKRHKTNPSSLPYVIADTKLHKLFPHKILPHYVWIDKGVISGITDQDELTASNIQKILDGDTTKLLRQKKDMKIVYDKSKPYLINGNGGDGSKLLFHSLLSSYQEGINSGYDRSFSPDKGRRIFMRNVSITMLFQEAMSNEDKFFDNKRTLFEVKDRSLIDFEHIPLKDIGKWKNKFMYCYDLIIPPNLYKEFYNFMYADLHRLFPQYTAGIERKPTPCIVLIRTSTNDKLKSRQLPKDQKMVTGGMGCHIIHGNLEVLVKRLDLIYMHAPLPVKDGTGITYPIDLNLKVDFSNLEELNKALEPYDLKFIKKDWPIEFLVIRDR